MVVEVFYSSAIPRESFSPAIEYLLAKWKTLKATNDLTLQRLTEESSYPIQAHLSYLLPTRDDFVVLYVGQVSQNLLGFDPTGLLLSEMDERLFNDFKIVYARVVKDNQPALVRFKSIGVGNSLIRQHLIMPIKIGDTTLIVSYSESLADRNEVFDYLFKTSPYVTFIIYPTMGLNKQYDDAWILALNDAAQVFIGLAEAPGTRTVLLLRSFAPFINDEFWISFRRALMQAVPRATFQFESMEVEVLRFGTITALRVRN